MSHTKTGLHWFYWFYWFYLDNVLTSAGFIFCTKHFRSTNYLLIMINFLGIFGKFILKTFVFEHPVDPNSSAFLNEHPVDHCYYPNTTLYQLDL